MEVYASGSVVPHGSNGQPQEFTLGEVQLNVSQNLTVEAIGAGTVAIEYNATISAHKLTA